MKKIMITIAALALCACAKVESDNHVNYVDITFEASFESTKTALDGNDVVWCAGDRIAIFAGSEKVVATIPEDGASVSFSVSVPEADT